MTWVQQVVHVVRKDLLMSRWYALALAGVVSVLTWMAIERGSEFEGTWALFVVVTAMIGICLVIQADSPFEARAFWASRPVNSSAMAAAKILDILLLVVAVRVIAALVLVLSDQSALRLPGMITDGGWLLPAIVTGAAMLAALTTDLRTFFVAAIPAFLAVSMIIAQLLIRTHAGPAAREVLDLFSGVITVGSVLVVFNTYRTRNTAFGVISVFFVVLSAQLAAFSYVFSLRPEA